MRTNEERIAAMHARAAELRKEKRKRETRLAGLTAVVLCLALTVALAAWMPRLSTAMTGAPGAMSASMFSDSGALGYIVVALLAFLLGVSVTVFCLRLEKWREEKDREDLP
jgi:cell division protein FtsW (lipid II flippase)